jgi:hypothetical protein
MSDASTAVVDKAEVERAMALYQLRETPTGNMYRRLAVDLEIKKLSNQVRVQARKQLYPPRTSVPASMEELSATEKRLLTGALEKATVDEAVRQIYDNMFTLTGWLYKGGAIQRDGTMYTQGGEIQGMCESYRNAFHEALKCYDALRPNRREGDLVIEDEQTLADETFCTRQGLTLMGSGLKGNVYLKVNGFGTPLEEGMDTINRFVFKGHWRLKVNGVVYDPIFHSIDEDNVQWRLTGGTYLTADGSSFLRDTSTVPDAGEFESTFVWITDWKVFEKTVLEMVDLYDQNKSEVDGILGGRTSTKDMFRADRKSYRKAKELVKDSVGDVTIFRKLVGLADHYMVAAFTRDQVKAANKALDLAAK